MKTFELPEKVKELRRQFKECLEIVNREGFDGGKAISCQINNALESLSAKHHNCLGCNLADTLELIQSFLKTCHSVVDYGHAYTQLIMNCYLLVERIETLFDLMKLDAEYRKDNFKILVAVRRWANFLKHPKAFVLTHHPTFSHVSANDLPELRHAASVVVDRTFVDKYYSNDEKNAELYKVLENKEKVLVIFPDASYIVTEMCDALRKCVEVIRDNRVYREALEKRSTFLDYWVDEDTAPLPDETDTPP